MNDNEILKYLLQCLEATTKEEKEKIGKKRLTERTLCDII